MIERPILYHIQFNAQFFQIVMHFLPNIFHSFQINQSKSTNTPYFLIKLFYHNLFSL